MSEFVRDFTKDSQLDKYALDVAAAEQAGVYMYWSEQMALARREEDACALEVKIARAESAQHIRETATKITEAGVLEAVTKDPKVQEAERKHSGATHKRSLAEASVRAMEQRKSMIEVLSRLWVAGYYGDPTKDRGTELAQRSRSTLNESMPKKD